MKKVVGLKMNIGANFIFKGISMLISFIYTPIFLSYMGDLRYGVWAIITSISSWLSLSDAGIGNGLKNKLAEALARKDYDTSKGLIITAYILLFKIMGIVFFTFIVSSFFFNYAKILNLNIEGENIEATIIIEVFFICLNLWLSLINSILSALQQPAIYQGFGVCAKVMQLIFIIVAMCFIPVSMPLIAVLMGIATTLANIAATFYTFKKYSYILPVGRYYEKIYIKSIASIGLLIFVNQICNTILASTDNILISKLFHAELVTPYSLAYKFFNYFVIVQGLIIMPLWPAYTKKKELHKYDWMRNTMKKMKIFTLFLSIICVSFVFIFPFFSDIWLKHHIKYDKPMLFFMAAYNIQYMFISVYNSFMLGVGKVKSCVMCSVIAAVLNIPLSVVFAKTMTLGLTGIIMGTFVSELPYLLIMPREVNRWFRDTIWEGEQNV